MQPKEISQIEAAEPEAGQEAAKQGPAQIDSPATPSGGPVQPLVSAAPDGAVPQVPPAPTPRERRDSERHGVDAPIVALLVRTGGKIAGRILDLGLDGCRILTRECFPVDVHTRVETEFRLQGLDFHLAGVVQAIHNRHEAGIRFLDVSERKREQLMELTEEIREAGVRAAAESLPGGASAGPLSDGPTGHRASSH